MFFEESSLVRIGLISDTHMPMARRELWPQIKEVFQGVDLILHAGDINELTVLDWLEQFAPVIAVRGNGDYNTPDDPRMKNCQVLEIEGLKLGMIHYLYHPGPPLEQTMRRNFGGPVDIIVHGDTHVEAIERHNGVLIVNPGSPTFPRNFSVQPGTVALLDVTPEGAEARIINLKDL